MKILPYLCVCLIILLAKHTATAQVVIEKSTFEASLQKAANEGKILMVIMDAKLNKQANKTTSEGLYNQSAFIINKQAVVIRPMPSGADWERLVKKYYQEADIKNDGVEGLFFNVKGELIHRCLFATSNPNEYFNQAFLASRINNLPNEKELLDSIKSSAIVPVDLFEQLLKVRNEFGKPTDDLLALFISNTSTDSFSQFRYFELLARLCPILHTKADSIFRRSNFNSNWNKLEAGERINIFHNINNKTSEKAVAEKNYALAHYLIDSTICNGLENASENDLPLLRSGLIAHFYWRVNDTAAYLPSAIDYADNYLMKLSVDSINKAFEKSLAEMKKSGQPFMHNGNGTAAIYGSQLNFHAWQFYKMSEEPALRQKALSWIKRANQFNSTPESLGAYALLLYATGDKKSAITEQKKVIRELKKMNSQNEISKAEKILDRMKKADEKADE